jgi:hypothetical protein
MATDCRRFVPRGSALLDEQFRGTVKANTRIESAARLLDTEALL